VDERRATSPAADVWDYDEDLAASAGGSSIDFEEDLPPRGERPRFRERSRPIDFEAGLPAVTLRKDAGAVPAAAPAPASETKIDPGIDARRYLEMEGQVPPVLTWAAVRKAELPELGDPGMDDSLARDVPPRYRFWRCATRESALAVREDLVWSGLFSEETVRKVNGELRRVTAVPIVKVYLPPAYDDSQGPEVPVPRRAVEKAASLLEDSDRVTTLFGADVVDVVGIETVMERVRTSDGDWIVAAKDTAEVRKALGGPAFRLPSRDDLVFATNAKLRDPDVVEWVAGSRDDEIVKHAFRDGRVLQLMKADDEERIVFGIVLEPDEVDAQGDTISAAEIRSAAHKFMSDFGNLGKQHKEIVNGKLKLLESFIAPIAFNVGKQKVKKGSWLMAERVVDDALWKAVKAGEFTGFSIGGSGVRKPKK
jgi:hypothetical protein